MIWQGAIDDKGFGYTKINGKKTLVHKFIALYYPEVPLDVLVYRQRMYVVQTCGRTICIKPAHLTFSLHKPEKQWEPRVDWWKTPLERVNSGY